MTPLAKYQRDLQERHFQEDRSQEQAVVYLQELFERLQQEPVPVIAAVPPQRRFVRLLDRFASKKLPPEFIQGLYFWGGVGRGKTYLMDLFYESLPFDDKMRVHFHRFMRRIHRDLKSLAGQKNPLSLVAQRIADETRIICFDEFFVSDITDAMILGGLFEHLFSRGVVLVATSNIVPDELYKNGLQRQRFLPAIELLKKHTRVVNVDGGNDYRLRALERAELYHTPLDVAADISLKRSFDSLSSEPGKQLEQVEIEGRWLQSRYCAEDVIWFDFAELCDGPRSQNDYIEIARIYHAVLVGNIPALGPEQDDQVRRFVNLIDEFYDRNVKLVVSAAMPLDQLYSGGRLSFEFERTRSRLLEMQSHDYLARQHRP